MSIRPEDVMPDNQDHVERDGKTIRKGTMAAALANAEIVESSTASAADKAVALDTLRELAPTIKAFGLMQFLTWNNPDIQKIFDES